MARYVIFPGTAGSYADTPDVNLLDADTSHNSQAVGANLVNVGSLGARVQSTDLTPVFGLFHGKAEATGTDPTMRNADATGTQLVSVSPGQVVSVGVSASADVSATLEITCLFYDAGFALVSGGVITEPAQGLLVSEFAHVEQAGVTVPANSVWLQTQLKWLGPVVTENVYWDAWIIRIGTDSTFIPSLRIVGDIDLETKDAVFNPASGTVQWLQTTRAGNGGYGLFINTDGTWGADHGDGLTSRQGIADTTLTAGQVYVLRATMVAGTWTFLLDGVADGIVVAAAGAGVPSGTALSFGQSTTTIEQFQGDGYTGSVRDGDETGPIVAIFDAEDLGI